MSENLPDWKQAQQDRYTRRRKKTDPTEDDGAPEQSGAARGREDEAADSGLARNGLKDPTQSDDPLTPLLLDPARALELPSEPGAASSDDIVAARKLRVRVATWNLGGAMPTPDQLRPLLQPSQHHVVAIGTQECGASAASSVLSPSAAARWGAVAAAALGPSYVLVRGHSLAAIHLLVFAHAGAAALVRRPRSHAVATGLANTFGNKGGIGIAFDVLGTSFLFATAHLASGASHVAHRNAQYAAIDVALALRPTPPASLAPPAASVPGARRRPGGARVAPEHAVPAGGARRSAGARVAPMETDAGADADADAGAGAAAGAGGAPAAAGAGAEQAGELVAGAGAGSAIGSVAAAAEAAGSAGGTGAAEAVAAVAEEAGGDTAVAVAVPAESAGGARGATREFDRVFWCGDFNYRVSGSKAAVEHCVASDRLEVLRANDQLARERRAGRVFAGLEEAPLGFPPTYKFDVGTATYDTGRKQRVPSWTDRVLFRPQSTAVLEYTSSSECLISDHLPVAATFDVGLEFDGEDDAASLVSPRHGDSESSLCAIA